MLRGLSWNTSLPLALAALCAPAYAQDPEAEFQTVSLRVVSSRPGSVTLDRGGNDSLRRGDRVTLRMKDGSVKYGTLVRIEERASMAELDDQSLVPPAGTRAEVLVPTSRLSAPPPPVTPTAPAPEAAPQQAPEHAPWPTRDEEWHQGEPLLARVHPLRPSERPSDIRGRIYSIFDYTRSTEDDRTDGFYRVGSAVTIENSAGAGERIQFEGELNYRNTSVPDNDDESATYLRIDRASYAVGGNRFEDNRYEFGRFLQDNAPEFGVIDGAEWDRRLDQGSRIGLSAGFMPEPAPQFNSIQDFQVSASYRWVHDASQQMSAVAGYQKTLHNADADRDLFLAQFDYLPLRGWTFASTAWIDYYTGSDTNKGQGVELTQAYVNTGRRWSDGSTLNLVYSHMAFPEMDRNEFMPVTAAQLANDHNDRISLQTRAPFSRSTHVHGLVGGWMDQDDSGGDGEAGVEFDSLLFEHVLVDLTGFAAHAKFTDLAGLRASFLRTIQSGRMGVEYELANNRIHGFNGANNDLPDNRLRLTTEHYFKNGWSLSVHLDLMFWDSENSVNLGFYLQKLF